MRTRFSLYPVQGPWSLRKVLVFLLSVSCWWLLWSVQPLMAHEAEDSQPFEAQGSFSNPEANQESNYRLQRTGPTVTAVIASSLSPVQHFARQDPTVLFTVPDGLRPDIPVTWEVEAQHLLEDGTPHPTRPGPLRFRMRATPDGAVSYLDDSGVDGVGFLQFKTVWTWPVAGAGPNFCNRSFEVQTHVLAELHGQSETPLQCGGLTWEHMARVQTLGTQTSVAETKAHVHISKMHDLAGLTGLKTAQISISDHIHLLDLLVHTPQLTTLSLSGSELEMPVDFLMASPHLTSLSLSGSELQLPADFLRHAPQLTSLSLNGSGLNLPPDFLIHTPLLTSLSLNGSRLNLHPDFLIYTPQLTSLSLSWSSFNLPPDFLRHTPQLTSLSLSGSGLNPPADFLIHTPQLASLSLSGGTLELATDFLKHTPLLNTLSLSGNTLTPATDFLRHSLLLTTLSLNSRGLALPADFLINVPRLTSLSLSGGELSPASDLLAPTTQLTNLSLRGSKLQLPTDLLTPTPQLTSLSLSADRLQLPNDLLAPATQLKTLTLDGLPAVLQADLLAQAPGLTFLSLSGNRPARGRERSLTLPPRLLAPTPLLTTLRIRNFGDLILPTDLLEDTPQLVSLSLVARRQFSFEKPQVSGLDFGQPLLPASFLQTTPLLKTLELRAQTLELQKGFLSPVTQLENLVLDSWGHAWGDVSDDQIPLPGILVEPIRQLTLRRGAFWDPSPFRLRVSRPDLRLFYLVGVPAWE